MRSNYRLYAAMLALAMLLAGIVPGPMVRALAENDASARIETREPTCTEDGYILREDKETHVIATETLPAKGHRFGPWTQADGEWMEARACEVCGFVETRVAQSEAERVFPRLALTGDMGNISKKTRVTLKASYDDGDTAFDCYAIMTLQGHSTIGLEKHNYTVRFYDDASGTQKHKLRLIDGQKEHKYILKADFYDTSQCRNIVGARVWRSMVATREGLHPRIAALNTLGAVDGFPVSVWLNGEFHGLYTLCLHKDNDLFGMEEGEHAALLICNRQSEDEALFRAPAELDEDGIHDWEMEFCGTEDWSWARDSFNDLIDFVQNSSDEAFRTELGERLDVNAAIDYLIFLYALGLENGGTKDLVMVTYGDVWIPSAYDMDEAFGLRPEGAGYNDPANFLPACADGIWDSGTDSLLWDRLLNSFYPELLERYGELRQGVLSEDALLEMARGFIGNIPASLYVRDAERFPNRNVLEPPMSEQIETFITQRLIALDNVLRGE